MRRRMANYGWEINSGTTKQAKRNCTLPQDKIKFCHFSCTMHRNWSTEKKFPKKYSRREDSSRKQTRKPFTMHVHQLHYICSFFKFSNKKILLPWTEIEVLCVRMHSESTSSFDFCTSKSINLKRERTKW